jgi:hypothetical protein
MFAELDVEPGMFRGEPAGLQLSGTATLSQSVSYVSIRQARKQFSRVAGDPRASRPALGKEAGWGMGVYDPVLKTAFGLGSLSAS